MQRRDFLKAVAVAAVIPFLPSVPYAQTVSLTSLSAAFNLSSAVTGFITRGSNPTVPMLISIAQAVEALGIRIDAIDHKLDLMLEQIFEIRRLVQNLPYKTNLLGASVNLREPYTAFLELQPNTQIDRPSRAYLLAIPAIRERMRSARIRYLSLVASRPRPGFEAVIQLALAQDAELILAAEMQRPEMHDLGLAEDIRGTLGTLQAYGKFFDEAVNPIQSGSLTSLKASIIERINNQLQQDMSLGSVGPTSWGDEVSPRFAKLKVLLDNGQARAICGDDGAPLCLQSGPRPGGCAEPGYREYYSLMIDIRGTPIASAIPRIEDTLQRPILYETRSDMVCGERRIPTGSRYKDGIDRAIVALNHDIVNYYKIHYAHGICEVARGINATHQRLLRDLI